MDYEGPISITSDEDDKKKLHVKDVDVFTVIYSCEFEAKDCDRDEECKSMGDREWIKGHCGLIREEKSKRNLKNKSGLFQLWMCLPQKMDTTHYAELITTSVPFTHLPDNAGTVRIVAGKYQGKQGPIQTDSVNLWDMRLAPGHTTEFKVPADMHAMVFIVEGEIVLNDGSPLFESELGVFEQEGDTFTITTKTHTKLLFLGGDPINEPIIGHGKFELATINELRKGVQSEN